MLQLRSSPPPATDSGSLRPASARITSNPIGLMSPTDLVGPSPVTSNGTETTEIEDDASEEVHAQMMTEREGHQRTEVGYDAFEILLPGFSTAHLTWL